MRILVTGGAGFIGSTVVDHYVSLGHQVYVIDSELSGHRRNVNSKARFTKLDVRNAVGLEKYFAGKKFDVVNHHAAQIDVRESVANPVRDAEINILGLLNILELSKIHRVKKIIFSASGGTVYGDCTKPASEGSPEVPLSPYGVAKLASEKYIKTYSALYGLEFTIFRYANVYGPRQDPHGEAGVVAIFSNQFLNRERAFIYGSGRQSRDFVFVKDVAHANGLALRRGQNEIINIGTGKETSVLKLYQVMSEVAGFENKPIFKSARPGELNRSVVDIKKAKKVLGWTPRHSLKEGVAETLLYFKQKGLSSR